MSTTRKSVIVVIFSLLFTSSYAQPTPNQAGPASLPDVLLDACKGKKERDNCTITDPQNKILEGTCLKVPNAPDAMACLPKPPKEIIDACSGKNEGDSCSFVAPDSKKINGNCRKSPLQETEYLCIPGAPIGVDKQ